MPRHFIDPDGHGSIAGKTYAEDVEKRKQKQETLIKYFDENRIGEFDAVNGMRYGLQHKLTAAAQVRQHLLGKTVSIHVSLFFRSL